MTPRPRTRALVRAAVVVVAALAVVTGLLRVPLFAPEPAAADPVPIVTNPATTTADVDKCTGELGCVYPRGYKILDPTIPVAPEDAEGVNGLQAAATRVYAVSNANISPRDPRIVLHAETGVRGVMWQIVRNAISTAPASRTDVQKDIYHWFQTLVRDYQVTAARNARTEYDLWTARQCGYRPPTNEPAYYSGGGCDPDRTGIQSLTQGALTPSVEQFAAWGTYLASQKLTSPKDHANGPTHGSAAADTFASVQEAAQVSASVAAIAADVASVALDFLHGGGGWYQSWGPVASRTAVRVASFIGRIMYPALTLAAPVMVALAVLALVVGTIQQIENAQIPGKLDEAVNRANVLPDLRPWVGDADKEALMYLLFLGQTTINNVNRPQSGIPDWHGDKFVVQPADADGNPVGASTSGKAVSLQTWDAPDEKITVLADLGWFETSTDGGASWLTTSTLPYTAWDGAPRVARVYGDRFAITQGNGTIEKNFEDAGSCGSDCGLRTELRALDANGDRVIVSLQLQRPVQATIESDESTYVAGETTTFRAPDTDPADTTYTWTFEGRASAQAPANFVLCQSSAAGPGMGCDPAFHGNPGITKTGRSVAYTWPRAGTYHVRMTTTNPIGQTSTTDRDVTVVAGAAPTLDVITKNLGPMRSGNTATIAGCLDTSPGTYALPKVTVDWGDGTTESAQPPTGVILVGFATGPEPSFVVKSGGIDGPFEQCEGDWSFRASHTYTSGSAHDFPIALTAEDGDGQSVTDTSMTARVGPTDISTVDVGPTNATGSTVDVVGIPDGTPLYDAGDAVDMNVEFDVSPYAPGYEYFVQFNWGDGTSTAFLRPGGIGGGCTSSCQVDFDSTHRFDAKPGAPGIGAYTFTALLIDEDDNIVSQWTSPIAVRTQPPEVTDVTASPSTVPIGSPVTVSGDVDLPTNGDSPVQVTVTWSEDEGDTAGPRSQTVTLPPRTTHFAVTQPGYVDDGTHDVTVTVADNAGGVTTEDLTITATNVAPAPTTTATAGAEGSPVVLDVATGAPVGINSYTQTVDWGDGTTPTVTAYGPTPTGVLRTPEHTYAEAGTYTVTIDLVDQNGGAGQTTTMIDVDSASPLVTLEPGAGSAGSAVVLTGDIDDPGSLDTFTGTVDWRDGSTPETFTRPSGGTFTLEHTYAVGGVYAPVVTVTDQHGNPSPDATAELTVQGVPRFTGPRYDTPEGYSVDAPEGVVGTVYQFAFGVGGYPAPTVEVVSGALPPGLTLDEDGILSGTPTTVGDYEFQLAATNTHGSVTTPAPVEVTIGTAPGLDDVTVDATEGASVGRQLVSTGFPSPTFTTTGTLPPGLTVSPTGRLAGTPTTPGSWTFTVTATNFIDEASADVTVQVQATQAVRFTTSPAAAVVGATYRPGVSGGLSGNPVTLRSTSPGVCTLADGLVTFVQPGACELEAHQAGSGAYAEGSANQTILVSKAATTTTLGVGRELLTAAVAVLAPGAGEPTGEVVFRVDGDVVGRAAIVDGVATLAHRVPSGARRTVSAAYPGDGSFAGSSASAARQDPQITASLSSRLSKNRLGWYRTAVTVTFACTERGAVLAEPCPAPVVLTADGAGQSLTRSVNAVDGGIGTVTTRGISIDRTDPAVAVRGTAANPRCVATDALSGIDTCRLKVRGKKVTATAIDRAGNRAIATRIR